jgi:glucose/arabinose dehydrogenase
MASGHGSYPHSLLALLWCGLLLCGCGSGNPRSDTHRSDSRAPATQTGAAQLVPIGAGLEGPPYLRASLYAQGPRTLATFAFDRRGRLWMTAAGLESHTQDGVYVLAAPGGTARKVISGLDDPLGIDWYENKLYVASVGRVDVYWNFNGASFASHRLILRGPLAGGENNLLVTAPGGRLVMGVSASCDHCTPTSRWDGAVVSFLPDGRDLRLYASRIRAPVGLTFVPGTSNLLVTMNQQDNLGAETPGDSLSLVKEGQDWRFPECHGQGGPDCAGVPSPVAVLDKHAAIGGVAVTSGQLGPSVGTAAIVAEWNVAKVQAVSLTRHGNGYRGAVSPFLTGMERPLAVALSPGRFLLVGDWATGRIYRVAP